MTYTEAMQAVDNGATVRPDTWNPSGYVKAVDGVRRIFDVGTGRSWTCVTPEPVDEAANWEEVTLEGS